MALAQEDIEQIQQMIQESIRATPEVANANVHYELELRERTIRVEEELKHQRELMMTGFRQTEKRFEQIRLEMDKRFEQVDKRFEQINKRFEQVDKRFEQVDKRFEQIDKRFEQVDKRFEKIDKQLMDIHQEIKALMRWSFGILLGVGSLVIGILKIMG